MKQKRLFHSHPDLQGFTMTEIVIVVVVIGILAGIALPRYFSSIERTRYGEGVQVLKALRDAQINYSYENAGSYAADPDDLDVGLPTMQNFQNVADANPPTVADNAAALATVTEKNNNYVLSINVGGTITCGAGTAGNRCAAIGCTGAGGECN